MPYRDGVALQPKSLDTSRGIVTAALDKADLKAFKPGATIAVAGIGASLYAAQAATAQMRLQGLRAMAFPGTELYDPRIDVADVYVALSASGRSVEPAKAMEARPNAVTFGIAKAADTPLAKVVKTMIGTGSGADSGPNTTSYVGSLQALGLLADRIGTPSGADWTALPGKVEEVLALVVEPVRRAADLLTGRTSIDCVGAGLAFGTAGYAALLIREAVRAPAQNWDTLNFLHGPMEPNDGGTSVLLFGDGREVPLARDLAGFGIPTVLVTSRTDLKDAANLVVITVPALGTGLPDAILQALPAQLLTADMSEAVGLPVCEFRYRQTDTKLAVPAAA
ncbi:glucosamine--fructose-6-phosphate aminotransferase [Skermanella stibiiresistens SB22]|uniref:Glutamine--fructose-6-phosphate aminotransferase [isomerizing] n=1 Tax=Skermanella stibiiresistens SB22 TaxID=1385369 RepID=W9H8C3_9PROT|nr:glucosamine--fructose-6-phosphate aminotransferase [Skermanella stibiiresistens SB22]